jgi:hypothetical protein
MDALITSILELPAPKVLRKVDFETSNDQIHRSKLLDIFFFGSNSGCGGLLGD